MRMATRKEKTNKHTSWEEEEEKTKPEPGSENRSPELFGGEEPSNNVGGNESLVRASAWTWVGGAACWLLQAPYHVQFVAQSSSQSFGGCGAPGLSAASVMDTPPVQGVRKWEGHWLSAITARKQAVRGPNTHGSGNILPLLSLGCTAAGTHTAAEHHHSTTAPTAEPITSAASPPSMSQS